MPCLSTTQSIEIIDIKYEINSFVKTAFFIQIALALALALALARIENERPSLGGNNEIQRSAKAEITAKACG